MAQIDMMIQVSNDANLIVGDFVGERVIYAYEEMVGNNRILFVMAHANNQNPRVLGSYTFYKYVWNTDQFVRTNQISLGVFDTDPIPNEIEFHTFFGTPFQDFVLNSNNTELRTAVNIFNEFEF
jgi:hypothetical protein